MKDAIMKIINRKVQVSEQITSIRLQQIGTEDSYDEYQENINILEKELYFLDELLGIIL